jgi:hypothetical protein
MKQTPSRNLDRHDWDARASEALRNAKKLPPGSKRTVAIRKAGQLRIAADMKDFLMTKARQGAGEARGASLDEDIPGG